MVVYCHFRPTFRYPKRLDMVAFHIRMFRIRLEGSGNTATYSQTYCSSGSQDDRVERRFHIPYPRAPPRSDSDYRLRVIHFLTSLLACVFLAFDVSARTDLSRAFADVVVPISASG